MNIPAFLYEEVQKYLNEKSYSHGIGDIIINILANVTLTSAYICVGAKGNYYIKSNIVAPRPRAINVEIHLFKRGELRSRLLIEILKAKVLLKIKVFHKSFSRRAMVAIIKQFN